MAIAFDASSNAGSPAAGSFSWSHTCTGSNRILFVAVTSINGDVVTGVTYAGAAMTQINKAIRPTTTRYTYLFYRIAPSTGSNTIAVTVTGGIQCQGEASSYTGAEQASQPDSSATVTASSVTTFTMSTTVVNSNCWLVGGVDMSASPVTAGSGTNVRQNPGSDSYAIGDSNGTVSTGSQSLNFVGGGSGNGAGVIASILPVQPRYWVGGTGNWDAAGTTHWSATSGGASGASVPDINTPVFINGSSGGGTITLTATGNCSNLDFTGFSGTFTGSSALNMSGSLTVSSGMTWSYSGAATFSSTTSGNTVTTNGKTFTGSITFNGTGGLWTLQDNLTSSSTVNLTAGNIVLGSVTVTLSGTGTVWNASSSAFVTPGTSTIKFTNATSSSKTFAGGGLTYYNLWLTGAGTGIFIISGSNTFSDFKIDTPPHTTQFTAGTTQYLSTFTVSGTAGNLMTLKSTSDGNSWFLKKITSGTVVCDYLSLQDSHAL